MAPDELKLLRDSDVTTVAQDKEGSVVHDMPDAAIKLDCSDIGAYTGENRRGIDQFVVQRKVRRGSP